MHICQIVNSSSNIEDNQNTPGPLGMTPVQGSPVLLVLLGQSWLMADSNSTNSTHSAVAGLVLFRIPLLLAAAVGLIFTAPVTTTTTAMVTRAELMGLTCAYVTKTHLIQQHQSIDHNLVRTSNTHFVRHQEPTVASECH